jgi:hypothetical protein
VEHLRQIQQQNQPILETIRDRLVQNVTTQWESGIVNAFHPALLAANISADASTLSGIMQQLEVSMNQMRPHRIFLFNLYTRNVRIPTNNGTDDADSDARSGHCKHDNQE